MSPSNYTGRVVRILGYADNSTDIYWVQSDQGAFKMNVDWMVPVEQEKEKEVKRQFAEGDLVVYRFPAEGDVIGRVLRDAGNNDSGEVYDVWVAGEKRSVSTHWLTPLEGEGSDENQQKLLLADLEVKKRTLLAEMASKAYQLKLVDKTIADLTKERKVRPV